MRRSSASLTPRSSLHQSQNQDLMNRRSELLQTYRRSTHLAEVAESKEPERFLQYYPALWRQLAA